MSDIDLLDPLVHLADGDAGMPACGATGIWHAGLSNATPHRMDVTCPECRDLAEERAWEDDEERRAGAMTDAEADRFIEDRRLR